MSVALVQVVTSEARPVVPAPPAPAPHAQHEGPIAAHLRGQKVLTAAAFVVIVFGLRFAEAFLVPLTIGVLKELHVQQAFLSVAGITAKGLFNSNPLLVETERQMMRAADEVTVLADHTKVGRQALAFLCEVSAIDTLIIDHELSAVQRKLLKGAGAGVVIAGATGNGRNGRRARS